MKFFSEHIRSRLTLTYVAAFAILLFIFSSITLLFLYGYLSKQLDLNLKEDLEIVEELLATNEIILDPLEKKSDHIPKPYERFVEIWSDSGKLLYHSSAFQNHMPAAELSTMQYDETPQYYSIERSDKKMWRVIAVRKKFFSTMRIIRISMSEDHITNQLKEVFMFISLLAPLFLGITGIGGYILARHALAPIDRMVVHTKKIRTENLKERLPVINPNDELGNLAKVSNELLDRLQLSFEQLQNFTTDASHELRTPLTVMRSVGEVGLQQSTTVDEFREVIGSMLEENQRLTHLIDSLLLLSKADSGRTALKIERHNINQLIAECIELLSILAEEKKLILTFVDTALIFAEVDKLLLRRALINLIDNAIKYTPQFGSVTISLEQKLNTVLINVQDTGIGIPQEHHEKLFDRFYRVDKDRSRETGGTGLGLAIVKWIVSVHGGSVSLKSLPKGSIFVLELPLRDQA